MKFLVGTILSVLCPVYAYSAPLPAQPDPVSNLRCPQQFDNRVKWSSSSSEFFYSVGTVQAPPSSCMDSYSTHTTSKEALIPLERGTYIIKVCAYDSSENSESEERSISCSI